MHHTVSACTCDTVEQRRRMRLSTAKSDVSLPNEGEGPFERSIEELLVFQRTLTAVRIQVEHHGGVHRRGGVCTASPFASLLQGCHGVDGHGTADPLSRAALECGLTMATASLFSRIQQFGWLQTVNQNTVLSFPLTTLHTVSGSSIRMDSGHSPRAAVEERHGLGTRPVEVLESGKMHLLPSREGGRSQGRPARVADTAR